MAGKQVKVTSPTPITEPPNLLEEEFAPHYQAWKEKPGPKTTGALLGAVTPVLESALRTYGGKNYSPTLKSRAKIMAMEAIQRYDPSRAKLRTHLMSHLQGLRRASAQESQIISIPERVGLDLFHLRAAESELRDQLGRDPSTMELSNHVHLSPKRIGYIRKAQPGMAEGLTNQPSAAGEEQMGVGPAVIDTGETQRLLHEFVYHDLDPIDQVIMEHSLGLHNRPVLPGNSLASKLNLSPGAISQRKKRIQEKLNVTTDLYPG